MPLSRMDPTKDPSWKCADLRASGNAAKFQSSKGCANTYKHFSEEDIPGTNMSWQKQATRNLETTGEMLKWALSHQGFARTCCRLLKWLNAPYAPYLPRLGLSTPSRFDHLIHYGGSYYCYLFNRVLASPRFDSALRNVLDRNWVEALAAHVWRQSFEADPFNPEVGVRLRGLVLQISNDNTYSIW